VKDGGDSGNSKRTLVAADECLMCAYAGSVHKFPVFTEVPKQRHQSAHIAAVDLPAAAVSVDNTGNR
jgi:hypothetical protein